jgi:hypothetical protein
MIFSTNGKEEKRSKPISKNVHQRTLAHLQRDCEIIVVGSFSLRHAGSWDGKDLRKHRERAGDDKSKRKCHRPESQKTSYPYLTNRLLLENKKPASCAEITIGLYKNYRLSGRSASLRK